MLRDSLPKGKLHLKCYELLINSSRPVDAPIDNFGPAAAAAAVGD